jgi:hypothetical protein
MAHPVDTRIPAQQSSRSKPLPDLLGRHPRGQQLLPRRHAVGAATDPARDSLHRVIPLLHHNREVTQRPDSPPGGRQAAAVPAPAPLASARSAASSISSVSSRSSIRSALPDVLIASSYMVTSLGQLTTK